MASFPIHMNLDGRVVLVVGAGSVGVRRAEALRAAGACLRWVAPDAPRGDAGAQREVFDARHLDGATLVFACAPPEINRVVVCAARARRIPVSRADAPCEGDFVVPARVRRGSVLMSLSTGGRAPAATAALRRALDELVPESWGRFAALIAGARRALVGHPLRAEKLRELARGPLLGILLAGDEDAGRALVAAVAPTPRVDGGCDGSRADGGSRP